MAEKSFKKKPSKAVRSPVPNRGTTLGGRVRHALVAGVAARYLMPSISHVAGLPSRLGIGFDGEEEEMLRPSSRRTTRSRKGLQLAIPPHLQEPSPTPPPIARLTPPPPPKATRIPVAGPVTKSAIKASPIVSQIPPPPPEDRPTPPSIRDVLGKAAKYGAAGYIVGNVYGALPAAVLGAIVGSKPKGVSTTEHLGRSLEHAIVGPAKFIGKGAKHLLPGIGRGVVDATKTAGRTLAPPMKSLGQKAANIGRSVINSEPVKNFREGLGQDVQDIKGSIGKGIQNIRDKFGFDNEEMISPSSRRATHSLSPGKALMTSLRAANEKIKLSSQKQPEHPSKTEEGKAFRNAAFQALKRARNGDTCALATALGIANLEQEPVGQTQALGQAGGVALPSQGRIDHGTRRNRADEGKMRASMDQLNNLTQGQTPQNPIGMDADEQLATVPSSQRATALPLSKGQLILKELRDRNALKERMGRAASFDGENMEGLEMANKANCDMCCCSPCCCTKPSSTRVNSPGRKVMAELRQQKVVRQKMEPVLQPMPAPSTRQDVI